MTGVMSRNRMPGFGKVRDGADGGLAQPLFQFGSLHGEIGRKFTEDVLSHRLTGLDILPRSGMVPC
jgi:hypothetical protein